MSAVPIIETERLILRSRTMEDFPAYAAMWADPAVARFTTPAHPLSEEEAWVKFCRSAGCWALKGYGFWIVEEKASGRFVGEAGAADFKRAITPSLAGKPEFGWVFAAEAHGRGYATEAIRAALRWTTVNLAAETYCCIIDPGNAPSIRVAEKCGFSEAWRATYKNEPIIVFERQRD